MTDLLVDLVNVKRICSDATRLTYGVGLRTVDVTPTGIRARLASWPRMDIARRALAHAGYATTLDHATNTLTVTGWNRARLEERAKRLDSDVALLERDHEETATIALDRFLELSADPKQRDVGDEQLRKDVTREVAFSLAAAEFPLAATERKRGRFTLSLPAPTEAELVAPHPLHELLVHITAQQRAITMLTPDHHGNAAAAISLYLEYRDTHGYGDGEQSRRKALNDVFEGIHATVTNERDSLDFWLATRKATCPDG